MLESRRTEYNEALKKVRETQITHDKIKIVKGILPERLRPHGKNPLSILHSALSEGLHTDTDEACLELAAQVREVLLYLIEQVRLSKEGDMKFNTAMEDILNKKMKN